jgi:hypothetical protein
MSMERPDVKTYKLAPEEIEKLLSAKFGTKIEPVNNAKLAKQRQQRARRDENKTE